MLNDNYMMLTRIKSFFRRTGKRQRYFLLMIPAVLVLLLLIWFLFVREKPGDHLHAVPLPGVTGAWADSVFAQLEPEEKFSLLMLYQIDEGIAGVDTGGLPPYSGGIFVTDAPALNAGFLRDYPGQEHTTPLLRIGKTDRYDSAHIMSLGIETLLSIRSDSLLQRYLGHHITHFAEGGVNVLHYPLFSERFHSLRAHDTTAMRRQIPLLSDYINVGMEYGLLPAFHLPALMFSVGTSSRLSDSVRAGFIGGLISKQLPLVTIDSLPVLPEGFQGLYDFLEERYGFTGLIVHRRPVTGLESLLRLLSSGVDMVAASAGNGALQRAFADRYRRDRSVRLMTDRAVMRVLLYKEWILMHSGAGSERGFPLDLRDTTSTVHLAHILTRSSIVKLNDDASIVPLPVSDDVPITFHIPVDDPFDALVNTSKLFTDIRVVRYRPAVSVLSDRGEGIHVVVLRSGSDRALPYFASGLNGDRHLLLHFGSVDSLAGLHAEAVVVHVSRDSDITRRQLANGIFGGIALDGVLPWGITGRFTAGMGMYGNEPVRLNHTIPEEAGLSGVLLQQIDTVVREAILNGAFPGCQVFVAWRGEVVYHKSFGHHTYEELIPVMPDHLFDVASVTKVAATTLAVMRMIGSGKMHPNHTLGTYFVHTTGQSQESGSLAFLSSEPLRALEPVEYPVFKIPLRLLLTHRSGLPAALPVDRFLRASERALPGYRTTDIFSPVLLPGHADIPVADGMFMYRNYLDTLWKYAKGITVNPARNYVYSDANMVFLQMAIDSVNGMGLDRYVQQEIYGPMGLRHCLFNPLSRFDSSLVVPTANDMRWRRRLVHGTVHDPTAALLGGVAGNAGLFSNALDLGVLGQMLLNVGSYGGVSFFDTALVQMFVARQPGGHRALGFDMPSSDNSVIAKGASRQSYGHIGFTGTCFWVDPEHELVYVFLSNRIHPNTENRKINFLKVRERVHQVVYDAIAASKEFRGHEGSMKDPGVRQRAF
jgi:serine-type D-Ala-D-Ala carboxypeptidase